MALIREKHFDALRLFCIVLAVLCGVLGYLLAPVVVIFVCLGSVNLLAKDLSGTYGLLVGNRTTADSGADGANFEGELVGTGSC